MKWFKKNNTYIFIAGVIYLTMIGIALWKQRSLIRKLVTAFAVLAAAHEIEEKIWPGGFFDLMLNKFGMKKEEVDLGRATSAVSVYWVLILALPFIFDTHPWLLVITIALSFFEAFVHTAGIAIHHMKKPYTPGLVTAWLLAALAVISMVLLNRDHLVSAGGYAVGTLLMIVSFLCMDIFIVLEKHLLKLSKQFASRNNKPYSIHAGSASHDWCCFDVFKRA